MVLCGNRIKAIRALKGMSQSDLANAVGVSFVTVSKWERGVAEPTAENLVGLAGVLGCSIDYLIGRRG